MGSEKWVTDSQDEQSLEDLYRDADQIHIPIFQRSYVWKKKQFDELTQDIRLIREGVESSQFLGAIVAYERPRQHEIVGRMKTLAVVDGQQRLLTLYVFVMAICEIWAQFDKEAALEIVRDYLLLQPRRGLEINTRIVPAYDDRYQFRMLWNRLEKEGVLAEHLKDNPPAPPTPSGNEKGYLRKQYRRIYRYLSGIVEQEGQDIIQDILELVARKLTFVHLKLNDASAATKIFERLNFRGVKVGIMDLVRNEVFARTEDSEAKVIFDKHWRPFEKDFDNEGEKFFFPYALIYNSQIKKSQIFTELRSIWNEKSAPEVISHMKPFQKPYMALVDGRGYDDSPEIAHRLEQLIEARRPSSTYPFVMKCLYEYDESNLSESQVVELLDVIESFLVRRAVAGYEPTGLHALFKGLYEDLPAMNASGFQQVVASKPTIQWPSEEEIKEAVNERSLAKAKICTYLLTEYDKSLPGDDPGIEPSIEHVLPTHRDTNGYWSDHFTKKEHKRLKDTLGNLVPLSRPLNSSLQTAKFDRKAERYEMESAFVTPRVIAKDWDEWTPVTIESRNSTLADWITERWAYGPE